MAWNGNTFRKAADRTATLEKARENHLRIEPCTPSQSSLGRFWYFLMCYPTSSQSMAWHHRTLRMAANRASANRIATLEKCTGKSSTQSGTWNEWSLGQSSSIITLLQRWSPGPSIRNAGRNVKVFVNSLLQHRASTCRPSATEHPAELRVPWMWWRVTFCWFFHVRLVWFQFKNSMIDGLEMANRTSAGNIVQVKKWVADMCLSVRELLSQVPWERPEDYSILCPHVLGAIQ